MPPQTTEFLARLRGALGTAVSTDANELADARTDRSGYLSPGVPVAIVTARSIDDVQVALRLASEFLVPVVPRGAGTGLAGGATATNGALVISTTAMNRVLEISLADELAVVEPGVLNQQLSDQVLHDGYIFSPDPASKAISTIGGNIATNAGGLLCAKYGVTRDAVLGLKVVLADGRLISTGHRSVKGVTGLDLTALLTGSEGTLGIIVEATVRLRPIPAGLSVTIGTFFESVTAAAAASAAITAARLKPAVMELMDAESLLAVDALNGTSFRNRGAAYLLIQTDGPAAADEANHIVALTRLLGGMSELSTDPAEGERLLAIRRSFHPALEARGSVLIEDVCVPRSALAAMFAEIELIGLRHGLRIATIAHAGDGNLHPNFVLEPGVTVVPDAVWLAAGELFEAALSLGGTLTGEHGVGVLKKRWLEAEIGPGSFELQQQIKAVFDPLGIMNPGKVF
ncbi:FAD-binding protein [Subtercola sp. PAMC28395]|uniref:FAD-binding oxidoreductase n=1 Tax=Subtercola sp. PAMC28395 TaxID=2846775 RepID=UPI001C0E4035|nr:FAD-linked oxidase C-terminal domain-containing protein [Subtercola sp. PAMC28395]QWT23493.1 FAD-binding protein [Subtercola sp. PAMC28395]